MLWLECYLLPLKLARKIRKLRARTSHKAKLIRVGAASFDYSRIFINLNVRKKYNLIRMF